MVDNKEIDKIIKTLEGAAMLCYEAEDVGNFYKGIEILQKVKMDNKEQLSETMRNVLLRLQEYGSLVRFDGGFWSWKEVDFKPQYNENQYMDKVPVWHCDVRTLRALQKRGLVKLDETLKFCVPVN